jgi:hypothetical protein
MKNKSNHILYYAARLPVLLLYCCFFTVQLLSFNSDASGSNATQLTSWYHNDGFIKNKSSQSAEKTSTRKQNNVNIRLNKRFHPEKPICYHAFILKTPGYRLLKKLPVIYGNDIAPLTSFAVHLLRGPPVVVA